ncbi:MAG: TolC family protein [Leptospiraceae bacterium]|nr:TolC family protein [Leptospiraceae bacterium]MCK6382177.1 TolC family protein [Leptospiraceae bacterium]
MKVFFRICCVLLYILSYGVFSEDTIQEKTNTLKEKISKEEKKAPTKKIDFLSLKDAIVTALSNNVNLKNIEYELVKSDSNLLKSQSKYTWRVLGGLDSQKSVLPFNQSNLMTGTKTQNDKISVGIEKIFITGTYFKLEASTTRFDSNAFEDPSTTPAGFRVLGIPPLYTGAITATLSQELLKNSFGYQDRNLEKILENQAAITRDELIFKLSGSVVQTLVDYWGFSVADAAYKAYEKLWNNAKNIRNLTRQKQNIGLSEKFEVNQWSALVSQAENQMEKAKVDREEAKRKLIRAMGLSTDSDVTGAGELFDNPPEMNYEKDLEFAFKNRIDFKNMQRKKQIVDLTIKNAENSALPSLTAMGSYSSKGQTLISPQENFTNQNSGIPTFKFEERVGQLKLVYPVADRGVKATIRDAHISLRQTLLSEEDLKKEIRDEIKTRISSVEANHRILQNSIQSYRDAESYYNGILSSFRKGRFTAVAVKNALDTVIQNQLQLTQAKINFNIDVLRYELAKNSLFDKYKIDVNSLVPDVN